MKDRYPTRPFELWQKAKELRLKNYRDIVSARDEGKLLFVGQRGAPYELLSGFGDFKFLAINDYAASVANFPDLALECFQALEGAGYARDLCGYFRTFSGSMLLDKYLFGGKFPRADFVFTQVACDTNGKACKVIADHMGAPYISVDIPICLSDNTNIRARCVEYIAQQLLDAIDCISRRSGRGFDDNKLIESIANSCRSQILWAEIMELNQAIPATMDMKAQFSLFMPLILGRHLRETVEFYSELKAEVQERVRQGIAATPVEKCRLLYDGVPPWFSLHLFRLPQRYGAVYIGSYYTMCQFGAFAEGPDGRYRPKTMPEELRSMKGREEAVRFLARWFLEQDTAWGVSLKARCSSRVHVVKEWHINGVVFHLNRGCEQQSANLLEIKQAITEVTGIPTIVHEGNSSDSREFSETETADRLESFLESLGLIKLND